MTKTVLQLVALGIVLLLAQVICNKIVLLDVATPIVFIYLILRLPVYFSKNWTYTRAFVLGFIVDLFNNTMGMNALSCTLLAAMRRPVFEAYFTRDDDMSNPMPSIASLGVGGYLKYMSTMVLAYCTILFLIQAFSLHDIVLTLCRIVASSALTVLLLFGIDTLVSTQREERL